MQLLGLIFPRMLGKSCIVCDPLLKSKWGSIDSPQVIYPPVEIFGTQDLLFVFGDLKLKPNDYVFVMRRRIKDRPSQTKASVISLSHHHSSCLNPSSRAAVPIPTVDFSEVGVLGEAVEVFMAEYAMVPEREEEPVVEVELYRFDVTHKQFMWCQTLCWCYKKEKLVVPVPK